MDQIPPVCRSYFGLTDQVRQSPARYIYNELRQSMWSFPIATMQSSASCFQILDHPADMGFRAWAPNLADLFTECGKALTSVLVDLETVECTEITAVEILGDDLESLLYNWLAEILYLFDGEKKLFSEFVIVSHKQNDGTEFLQAELKGERYVQDKHQIKTYVKAVTFHQMSIVHNEDGYCAQVYLDI